jgi:hypothetical protein
MGREKHDAFLRDAVVAIHFSAYDVFRWSTQTHKFNFFDLLKRTADVISICPVGTFHG